MRATCIMMGEDEGVDSEAPLRVRASPLQAAGRLGCCQCARSPGRIRSPGGPRAGRRQRRQGRYQQGGDSGSFNTGQHWPALAEWRPRPGPAPGQRASDLEVSLPDSAGLRH
jgi:hypothetical protein